jgi:rod shape determining protein RodA
MNGGPMLPSNQQRSQYFSFFFDGRLLLTALTLVGIGLLAIFATNSFFFKKQIFSLAVAIGVFFVTTFLDYRIYKKLSEFLYGCSIFLLILVLNMGTTAYGAQRWIQFGNFSFQPSEIAKLALIIAMAKFFEMQRGKLNSLLETLPSFILIGIPFFIIFKQPDLGSAIILIGIFLFMALWAGMSFTRLFLLASPLLSLVLLFAIPWYPLVTWTLYLAALFIFMINRKIQILDAIVFWFMNVASGIFSSFLWNTLTLYQKNRLISFINPDVDPTGLGLRYHTVKSVIAVGSGGIFGKGYLHGPLTNLQYIPQQHTDFIFSVIGEQFGLLGSIVVLGLFFYLFYRLINIALESNSMFGTLLVTGITSMLFVQFAINIGMNIGLIPVVGIPLPFLSFGGTSLILTFACLGIAESVRIHKGGND